MQNRMGHRCSGPSQGVVWGRRPAGTGRHPRTALGDGGAARLFPAGMRWGARPWKGAPRRPAKEQAVTGDDTRSGKASGAALTLYGPARRGRGGAGVGGASHPVGPAARPDRTFRGGFSPWAGPPQWGPRVPRGHLQAETRAAPCPTGAELD